MGEYRGDGEETDRMGMCKKWVKVRTYACRARASSDARHPGQHLVREAAETHEAEPRGGVMDRSWARYALVQRTGKA
jgi:hypothetical protein